jgi:hypothetical protein
VVAIWTDGSVNASLDAGAPEQSLPGWSGAGSLIAHVEQYFASMGVPACQIANTGENQLAAPGGLAAFKAKLPANAQGDGRVVIHHRVSGSSLPFTAVTTYDTVQLTPEDDGGDLHFDPAGNPVTDTWEAF